MTNNNRVELPIVEIRRYHGMFRIEGLMQQRDADQLVVNDLAAKLAASEVREKQLLEVARVALKYFQQMQHLIPQAPMGFFSEREPVAICSRLENALAEWKETP